jgi:hypothetical protein
MPNDALTTLGAKPITAGSRDKGEVPNSVTHLQERISIH